MGEQDKSCLGELVPVGRVPKGGKMVQKGEHRANAVYTCM
jgi:hypothetical protein